jgi:hypothetical protein
MVGEYLIIHIKFTSSSLAYSAPILICRMPLTMAGMKITTLMVIDLYMYHFPTTILILIGK